jgi:hypothetical protein
VSLTVLGLHLHVPAERYRGPTCTSLRPSQQLEQCYSLSRVQHPPSRAAPCHLFTCRWRAGDKLHLVHILPEPPTMHPGWTGLYVPPGDDMERQEVGGAPERQGRKRGSGGKRQDGGGGDACCNSGRSAAELPPPPPAALPLTSSASNVTWFFRHTTSPPVMHLYCCCSSRKQQQCSKKHLPPW